VLAPIKSRSGPSSAVYTSRPSSSPMRSTSGLGGSLCGACILTTPELRWGRGMPSANTWSGSSWSRSCFHGSRSPSERENGNTKPTWPPQAKERDSANRAARPGSSSGIRHAGLTGRKVVSTTRVPLAYSPGSSARVRLKPYPLYRRNILIRQRNVRRDDDSYMRSRRPVFAPFLARSDQ
jgi:hypothetical protein